MPRITLGDRLQAIVDSPNLPASKLNFAKSLLAFYQRKRMLTKGRRHWVDNLEACQKFFSDTNGRYNQPVSIFPRLVKQMFLLYYRTIV